MNPKLQLYFLGYSAFVGGPYFYTQNYLLGFLKLCLFFSTIYLFTQRLQKTWTIFFIIETAWHILFMIDVYNLCIYPNTIDTIVFMPADIYRNYWMSGQYFSTSNLFFLLVGYVSWLFFLIICFPIFCRNVIETPLINHPNYNDYELHRSMA